MQNSLQVLQAKEITLGDLIDNFNLELVEENDFFPEWQENLPSLSDNDREQLDKVKAGYLNLLNYPPFLENAVPMTILDPLFFIGNFYLFPFYLKAEESVEISTKDEDTIIKGRIDTLILKDQIWVMIIESKRVIYSLEAGLAQILAYLLASHQKDKPVYGMITNGGEFIFVKLLWQEKPRYAISNAFFIRNQGDLSQVLKILKALTQLALNYA